VDEFFLQVWLENADDLPIDVFDRCSEKEQSANNPSKLGARSRIHHLYVALFIIIVQPFALGDENRTVGKIGSLLK